MNTPLTPPLEPNQPMNNETILAYLKKARATPPTFEQYKEIVEILKEHQRRIAKHLPEQSKNSCLTVLLEAWDAQSGEVLRLQEEKAQAVKDAVADVLRQMRQPLRDKPTALDLLNRTAFMVVNDERTNMNEAADALARKYGVELGEWPTLSEHF
jgi:hypothetical protein